MANIGGPGSMHLHEPPDKAGSTVGATVLIPQMLFGREAAVANHRRPE